MNVMITTIEGIPLVGLTAPGLLGFAILMLMTGKLWTNAAYQQKVRECDKWQDAYEAEREARTISDSQTVELLEVSKTTHAVTVAMFDTIRLQQAKSGGAHVVPKD